MIAKANQRFIEPPRTIEAVECRAEASSGRIYCPVCEKAYSAGSIVTGDPEEDHERRCSFVLRQVFCDHCNHIITWREILDGSTLTGHKLDREPGLIRGKMTVAKFLVAHPEATGVSQR